MPALPQSNIHLDILMGRDETLDVADFFGSRCHNRYTASHVILTIVFARHGVGSFDEYSRRHGEEAAHAVKQLLNCVRTISTWLY